MDSEDGPPPLEDMTEILQQVNALREKKQKRANENIQQKSKPNGHAASGKQLNGNHTGDVSKPKKPENIPISSSTVQKSVENSEPDPETKQLQGTNTQKKSDGFGGMKKGFLFGGASKSQTNSNTDSQSNKQKSNSEVKEPKTLEEIPFIKKKVGAEKLQFSEVQEAMATTNSKLLENKEWVTDDLLEQVEKNEKLTKRLQNPMFVQAIGEFQKNPQEAMVKYGSNKEVQEFFKDFCGLMGQHFNKLADKQDPSGQTQAPTTPVVTATPPGGGAEMSVRSSTNPKQPTSADERKMQEILSDPDIRMTLMDPQVQGLFEALRNNPAEGQRLLQGASIDLKQKIQKLVGAGLLQFQ